MSHDTEAAVDALGDLRDARLLGNSGLRVSPLCFGCMNLGDSSMADQETSRKLMEQYIEQGGNFFDTANVYEKGMSEKWLGEFLQSQRSRAVIATKFGGCTDGSDPNAGGNHRKNLVQSLDASLKRLGTDYVDLLYVHIWEYRTPVEEVMRSLDDVVRSGKALYMAISDTVAWKIAQANTTATLRGWSPFVGVQTQYSLTERTAERDLLPCCRELGLGVVPWGSLSQGLLTGKYNHLSVAQAKEELTKLKPLKARDKQREQVGIDTYRPKAVLSDWTERNRQIALTVADAAEAVGRSSTQVALNWVASQPAVTAPVFAVRTAAQLEEVIGSLRFRLPAAQMQMLNEVSAIDMGFPQRWKDGDFLVSRNMVVEKRAASPYS